MKKEDMLYVAYDESEKDEPCICITRSKNGKLKIAKVEYGKQAKLLYRALTEQSMKISEEEE